MENNGGDGFKLLNEADICLIQSLIYTPATAGETTNDEQKWYEDLQAKFNNYYEEQKARNTAQGCPDCPIYIWDIYTRYERDHSEPGYEKKCFWCREGLIKNPTDLYCAPCLVGMWQCDCGAIQAPGEICNCDALGV